MKKDPKTDPALDNYPCRDLGLQNGFPQGGGRKSSVEALTIRIGFGVYCTRIRIRNPQNSIGNY